MAQDQKRLDPGSAAGGVGSAPFVPKLKPNFTIPAGKAQLKLYKVNDTLRSGRLSRSQRTELNEHARWLRSQVRRGNQTMKRFH